MHLNFFVAKKTIIYLIITDKIRNFVSFALYFTNFSSVGWKIPNFEISLEISSNNLKHNLPMMETKKSDNNHC